MTMCACGVSSAQLLPSALYAAYLRSQARVAGIAFHARHGRAEEVSERDITTALRDDETVRQALRAAGSVMARPLSSRP